MTDIQTPVRESTTPSLQPASDLMRSAWAEYKRRWRFFLLLLAAPMVLALLAGYAFSFGNFDALETSSNSFLAGVGLALVSYIPLIVETALIVFGELLLILALMNPTLGFRPLLSLGLTKIARAWWLTLIGTFAAFGGSLLLLIPGIYLAVAFTFALYVFLEKGMTPLATLSTCWALVRGRWLSVVWRLILLGLLSWFINLVAGVIFSPIPDPYYSLIGDWIVTLFWLPLSTAFTLLLYKDLQRSASQPDMTTMQQRLRALALLGLVVIVFVVPLLLQWANQ